MANARHLAQIKQGIDAWNNWRRENPELPNLAQASLQNAFLRRTFLDGVDFREARLHGADLKRAFLSRAFLSGADLSQTDLTRVSLNGSDLSNANLTQASLRWACLSGANLRGANLSEADLVGADLTGANLSEASLVGANLGGADLTGAILVRTKALKTNLSGAILTGVCLEDWCIDRMTQLDDILCDYIYLKSGKQNRYPCNRYLTLGEFSQLFQKALGGTLDRFNESMFDPS
jgi:uncharacterized protein YjbI with pentapeptide repeats